MDSRTSDMLKAVITATVSLMSFRTSDATLCHFPTYLTRGLYHKTYYGRNLRFPK
jgi:hypothetical protein